MPDSGADALPNVESLAAPPVELTTKSAATTAREALRLALNAYARAAVPTWSSWLSGSVQDEKAKAQRADLVKMRAHIEALIDFEVAETEARYTARLEAFLASLKRVDTSDDEVAYTDGFDDGVRAALRALSDAP